MAAIRAQEDMVATKDQPILEVDTRVVAINKTIDIKKLVITMTEEAIVEVAEGDVAVVVQEEGKVEVGEDGVLKTTTRVVSLSSTSSKEVINIINRALDKEGITLVEVVNISVLVELR